MRVVRSAMFTLARAPSSSLYASSRIAAALRLRPSIATFRAFRPFSASSSVPSAWNNDTKPVSGGASDEAPAFDSLAVGTPRKTAVRWEHMEVNLGEWGPAKAKVENIGEFLRLPESMLSGATTTADGLYPPALARQGLSAFMLRQTTLDVLEAVSQEASKEVCSGVIALDGSRGVGKSVTLLQTVSHCAKNGWVAIYLPHPSQWVNGTEPFEPVQGTSTFAQPGVAVRILKHFLQLNSSSGLATIKSESGENVSEIARQGVADPSRAQKALDEVLAALASGGKDRAKVLIAVDQINTFYCKTAYHDSESREVIANQLAAIQSFAGFFTLEKKLAHGALICAVDRSDTQHSSPLLNSLLSSRKSATASAPSQTSRPQHLQKQYHDLAAVDEFGVLLPERLAPASYDPLASATHLHPKLTRPIVVPPYDLYEVACAAAYYTDCDALGNVEVTRDYVEKELVLTGGNPLKLHKRCLSL
ncbi:mitochondrial ribosomal death-associated protein 3-domain-containing protein [Powellomyces hirtus]|nr:mitochondrial ribosomal death-associated protein 3-domain-containing protein [Powellomyces hirtus]